MDVGAAVRGATTIRRRVALLVRAQIGLAAVGIGVAVAAGVSAALPTGHNAAVAVLRGFVLAGSSTVVVLASAWVLGRAMRTAGLPVGLPMLSERAPAWSRRLRERLARSKWEMVATALAVGVLIALLGSHVAPREFTPNQKPETVADRARAASAAQGRTAHRAQGTGFAEQKGGSPAPSSGQAGGGGAAPGAGGSPSVSPAGEGPGGPGSGGAATPGAPGGGPPGSTPGQPCQTLRQAQPTLDDPLNGLARLLGSTIDQVCSTLPSVTTTTLPSVTVPTLPPVTLPPVTVPTLPPVTLPPVTVPTLPPVTLPPVTVPPVTVPTVPPVTTTTLPPVTVPTLPPL